MLRSFLSGLLVATLGLSLAMAASAAPAPVGLGDPGEPTSLEILSGVKSGEPAKLVGPDARLQLVVLARFDSGQQRDWTDKVQYRAEPAGIVAIDAQGMVSPLADGEATIHLRGPQNMQATLAVVVSHYQDPPPINFANQIVPIFTKLGCNSGGCHGKSGGQNGFALSLLGFEPTEDYRHLVKEVRGRRLFPAAPERSLLLVKATGEMPHGGGPRLPLESDDYRLLSRWIRQGMPYGQPDDPVVARLEVFPRQARLDTQGRQQLKVLAHYSDGSTADVSRQSQYDANNQDMATVDERGRVSLLGKAGQVAIMVRYQGQVAVFEALAPLGAPVGQLPPKQNFIDQHVFAKLVELGLPPSAVCDDPTYLRRVTLDIAGRLPTADEARQFADDKQVDKRAKLVDRLLASEDHVDYFAQKWNAILRNKSEPNQSHAGNYLFHDWIKEQLRANRPYDEFVREILTAAGRVEHNPPANWYGHVTDVNAQVEDAAQLFLGQRIQCARCHHHPFEKWSQEDYWGLAAFFANVRLNRVQNQGDYRVGVAWQHPTLPNPKNKQPVWPTVLGGDPLDQLTRAEDPRARLADWMGEPNNPFFARALVNRYWKHFFSRGIVEPEDDLRATNPPSNPALLDALAESFVKSGYDLRALVRTICTSTTYQLAAEPNEYNGQDQQNFSRFYPRRLPAEVLLDSVDQFLQTNSGFNALPQGMRAVQIPDFGTVQNQFLDAFGRPAGSSACECERAGDVTMAQCLQLLNSNEMYSKLAGGQAQNLASDAERDDEAKITELYVRALARPPRSEELAPLVAHLAEAKENEKHLAYEDILWAVINTKEFLFNH